MSPALTHDFGGASRRRFVIGPVEQRMQPAQVETRCVRLTMPIAQPADPYAAQRAAAIAWLGPHWLLYSRGTRS